jgi:hypothetical protein
MLHPSQIAASPRGQLFDHQRFAHGRLFYRFHGSEACRFSPQAAYRLLASLARDADGPATLWDPFCGTGFILAVAAYFFPDGFPTIVASDINPEAVGCAARNLALFADPAAFARRAEEMRKLRRINPAHDARWADIGAYFARLGAALDFARPGFAYQAMVADAALARRDDPRLTILGDLPYGRASRLSGSADYLACLSPLLARHPQARAMLVAPVSSAEDFRLLGVRGGRHVAIRGFKGGRIAARFAPVGAPAPARRVDEEAASGE